MIGHSEIDRYSRKTVSLRIANHSGQVAAGDTLWFADLAAIGARSLRSRLGYRRVLASLTVTGLVFQNRFNAFIATIRNCSSERTRWNASRVAPLAKLVSSHFCR